ncbi:hypothetical protein TorRG33x02_047130 [Trema orientale]|uniref:Uncharacterized protein n=1 Tax=Trema orientale TaxID=63057 RepID=A0A2P5FP54_TREOI|nr:hypothetical protein TorRG33x02_047130 [Trema orientale]
MTTEESTLGQGKKSLLLTSITCSTSATSFTFTAKRLNSESPGLANNLLANSFCRRNVALRNGLNPYTNLATRGEDILYGMFATTRSNCGNSIFRASLRITCKTHLNKAYFQSLQRLKGFFQAFHRTCSGHPTYLHSTDLLTQCAKPVSEESPPSDRRFQWRQPY